MKFFLNEKQNTQLKDKWVPSLDIVAYKAAVTKVVGDKYTLKDLNGKSTFTVDLSGVELPIGVGVGSKICINEADTGVFYISRMYKAPKLKAEKVKTVPNKKSASGSTPLHKPKFEL